MWCFNTVSHSHSISLFLCLCECKWTYRGRITITNRPTDRSIAAKTKAPTNEQQWNCERRKKNAKQWLKFITSGEMRINLNRSSPNGRKIQPAKPVTRTRERWSGGGGWWWRGGCWLLSQPKNNGNDEFGWILRYKLCGKICSTLNAIKTAKRIVFGLKKFYVICCFVDFGCGFLAIRFSNSALLGSHRCDANKSQNEYCTEHALLAIAAQQLLVSVIFSFSGNKCRNATTINP